MKHVVAAACALALAACHGGPAESAEEAYLRLLRACEKDDAALLFDALDTPTQWSIETTHHEQREMRRLIVEAYPAAERARALGRIPAAAEESEDYPRRYFKRLDGSAAKLADAKRRLFLGTGRPVGSIREHPGRDPGGTAEVWREGGSIFHFARDAKGRWGWSELRAEWEQAKLRAVHDAATVRANADLYRQRARKP